MKESKATVTVRDDYWIYYREAYTIKFEKKKSTFNQTFLWFLKINDRHKEIKMNL